MIRLEAILLCDQVVRQNSGKLQLQGIFDRIYSLRVPARHAEMCLYFRFFVESEDLEGNASQLVFILHRPKGTTEQLPTLTAKIDENGKIEGVIQLQGLPLNDWGEYFIKLYFNDKEVGSYRFECAKPTQQREDNVTVH